MARSPVQIQLGGYAVLTRLTCYVLFDCATLTVRRNAQLGVSDIQSCSKSLIKFNKFFG